MSTITAWDDPARDAATEDDYRWQAEQDGMMNEDELIETKADFHAWWSQERERITHEMQRARDELDALNYYAYDRLDQPNLDRISRANTILAELQQELSQ